MSFGSSTPLEVAVQGVSLAADRAYAEKVRGELTKLSFLRDLQYSQPLDYPTVDVKIDRERAGQYGLTMLDISKSLVAATSSSRYTDANYWRDPASGTAFQIQVEIPQNRMQSIADLNELPLMPPGASQPLLSEVASLKYGTTPGLIERYNSQRVVSLTANIHDKALGQAGDEVNAALKRAGDPPRGVTVKLRGQIPPLTQTISGLRIGLLLAVLVIFLLLAANFQSIRLALGIILTVPAVLCGVVLTLLITGTTLNVQSFMGAIMAIGIAVANSILLVTFAEMSRHEGSAVNDAAITGALGRLRAVLMTASAMIVGMLPMALGIGEGARQSAPLGRAVIGGLVFSTFATLTILPAIYAILQRKANTTSPSLNPADPASRYYEAS
jgi:multidrug efflux pump subunit AcrB